MNTQRFIGLELRGLSNLVRRKATKATKGTKEIEVYLEKATPMHGWIIGYLMGHEGEEVFQRDLEQEFSMRRSTVSRALQLMEKNGLVEREEVSHDARLKRIRLKKLAYEVHEARMKDIEIIEKELVQGVTQEELDMFFKIVDKMKKNLE